MRVMPFEFYGITSGSSVKYTRSNKIICSYQICQKNINLDMNYIIWIQFGKKHMFLLESVVDLRRAQGTRPLPVVQILSISYSFGEI